MEALGHLRCNFYIRQVKPYAVDGKEYAEAAKHYGEAKLLEEVGGYILIQIAGRSSQAQQTRMHRSTDTHICILSHARTHTRTHTQALSYTHMKTHQRSSVHK